MVLAVGEIFIYVMYKLYTMAFVRKIKKGDAVYLALVENRRIEGRVRQRVIKYLGKEIDGKPVKRVNPYDIDAMAVKHHADVLAIDRVAGMLGLHEVLGDNSEYVLAMAYSHLIERPSINRLEEWFSHTEIPGVLGIEKVSTAKLYETLAELSMMDFASVEEEIYRRLRGYERNKKAAVIDVTDTYFEGSKAGGKPRRGKDGKVARLLQIGLGVTMENGFPILERTYDGNISNLMIFQDLHAELRLRGFESTVIDRGMGSLHNLERIIDAKMKVVAGLRKTPALAEEFLSGIERDEIYSQANRVKLKNTAVYIHTFPYLEGELIAVYNPSLEVVKKEMGYEKGKKDEDLNYVGFSLIYHNTGLTPERAVRIYYEKDVIERAFKEMKGILSLRPIRVWRREQVKGHVRVCYIAYAILSLLGYHCKRLGCSVVDIMEKLKAGYKIYLRDRSSGQSWETSVVLQKELQDLLKELGVIYK